MALTIGNFTHSPVSGGHTGQSFSHNNDGDLLLLLGRLRQNVNRNITALTYNSVALSQIDFLVNEYASGLYLNLEAWLLVSPAAGSNTVAASYSGNCSASVLTAISLSGQHTLAPVGATNDATGNSSSPTVSLTTEAANSIVFGLIGMRRASGGAYTPGGAAVELTDGETGTAPNSDITFTDLYLVTTTAGGVSIASTNGVSSAQWSAMAVEIKEQPGPPAEGDFSGAQVFIPTFGVQVFN